MLVESNEDLIAEFRNTQLAEKYPELSFEEVKSIVSAPWRFLKKLMESYEVPSMRFMYLGVFKVYGNRAKFLLEDLEARKEIGKVDLHEYNRIKKILTKNIENNEKEN